MITYEQLELALKMSVGHIQKLKDSVNSRARDLVLGEILAIEDKLGCSIDDYLDNLNQFLMEMDEQRRDSKLLIPKNVGYFEVKIPFPVSF